MPGGDSPPFPPSCGALAGHGDTPGIVQRQNRQLRAVGRWDEAGGEHRRRPGPPLDPSSTPLPRTTNATSACPSQHQRDARGSALRSAPLNQHILPRL